MKPYLMKFFFVFSLLKKPRSQTLDQISQNLHQYLVFHTANLPVITHNGEIFNDKIIQHLNIVVIIRCTIYDSMFMACRLLTYPALRSKVRLLGSFHSFLVFPSKVESLCDNPKNSSEWYFRKHVLFVWNPICGKKLSWTWQNPQIV